MSNLITSKTSATKIAEECVQLFFLILLLVVSLPVNSQTYLDKLDSIEQKLDDIEFDRNIERMRRQYDQIDRDMERSRQQRLQRNELPPINSPLPTTCNFYYIDNKFWFLGHRYEYIQAKSWQSVRIGKQPVIYAFESDFYFASTNENINQIIINNMSIIENCPAYILDMIKDEKPQNQSNLKENAGTDTDILGWFLFVILGSAIAWWIYHLATNKESKANAQDDVKKIFPCPKCGQQCRVPAFKKIEVCCPRCKTSWIIKT